MITLDADRRGHVRPDAGEPDLGYMFLPQPGMRPGSGCS
jgi:hypothetical protein